MYKIYTHKASQLAYRQTDCARARHLARQQKREALKRQALPGWVDTPAILKFYLACPPGHHVDHVVPLRGKLVSGLHVLENLQYLPASENISKGNRFDLDEYREKFVLPLLEEQAA